MREKLKNGGGMKRNDDVVFSKYKIDYRLEFLRWNCSSEFLSNGSVVLTIGYLDRHRDANILRQLFIENELQVMTDFFDVENEVKELSMFVIYYFLNEYALLLSEEYRKKKGLTLPDGISFKVDITYLLE